MICALNHSHMHTTIISPYPKQAGMLAQTFKRQNIECITVSPEHLFGDWFPYTDSVIFYHPLTHETWERLINFLRNLNRDIPIILIGDLHRYIFKVEPFREFSHRIIYIENDIKLEEIPSIIKECSRARRQEIGNRYFQMGSLILDKRNRAIIIDSVFRLLTKKEYFLLELLMLNAGEVTSRDTIIDYVWTRRNFISQNTIEVYISRLRKKIDSESKKSLISTVPCLGYQLDKM
mgnify:CR=1 FL=1